MPGISTHINFTRLIHVDLHTDELIVIRPDGVDEAELDSLFKANIKQCDRVAIKPFLRSIKPTDQLAYLPPGVSFVSPKMVLKQFQDLMTSLKNVYVGEVQTIVIRPDQYMRFLSMAAEKFIGSIIMGEPMGAA